MSEKCKTPGCEYRFFGDSWKNGLCNYCYDAKCAVSEPQPVQELVECEHCHNMIVAVHQSSTWLDWYECPKCKATISKEETAAAHYFTQNASSGMRRSHHHEDDDDTIGKAWLGLGDK